MIGEARAVLRKAAPRAMVGRAEIILEIMVEVEGTMRALGLSLERSREWDGRADELWLYTTIMFASLSRP